MQNKKGFSVITIVIIAAVLIAIGGAIYFLVIKKAPGEKAGVEKTLEELEVSAPTFDMSLSPLPSLNASALNLSSPGLPSTNLFKGFSVNTDFSYQGEVELSTPSVPFTYTAPSTPEEETQQPSQEEAVNAQNCAQFSTVPSAQYCSMVSDLDGRTLCEQCKAAGF